MSRVAMITLRFTGIFAGLACSAAYAFLVLPLNETIVHYKWCALEFLTAYFLMTTGLVVFPRVRKFDLAIYCWVIVAAALLGQFFLSGFHLIAIPRMPQGLSGGMGILSAILPMYLVEIRGDARERRRNSKIITTRKSLTSIEAPSLLHH